MPIIRPLWNSESSGPRWPLPLRSAKGVRIGGIIGDKGRRVGGRETRFYAFSRKKTGTKRQGLYLPSQTDPRSSPRATLQDRHVNRESEFRLEYEDAKVKGEHVEFCKGVDGHVEVSAI
jgi:hypothetical protein